MNANDLNTSDTHTTRQRRTQSNAEEIRHTALRESQDLFEIIRKRKKWDTVLLGTLRTTDPTPLAGIAEAAHRIHQAIINSETITIITDFDMDGICAGTVMYAGLNELGANVKITIPDYRGPREITPNEIEEAYSKYPDTTVIITCDGGINSRKGIAYAQDTRGADVIVTDHHVEVAPGCNAKYVCNPNTIESTYPHPEICGAQVAHMLLTTYTNTYDRAKLQSIARLEVFAGIGALTDVMPLTHATRELVQRACGWLTLAVPDIPETYWGSFDAPKAHNAELESATALTIINTEDHHPAYVAAFEGLSLMMRELAAVKKLTSSENINVSFIGFTIGPMFNATRRIEGNMEDTFAVFMPDVLQHYYPGCTVSIENREISMRQIIANNELRKKLTHEAMDNIAKTTQPYAPYVYFAQAPAGIMGLLAANISRDTGLPAVVLNPKTFSGSARAPQHVPIIDITQQAAAQYNTTGLRAMGHQQACGFRAHDTDDIYAYVDTMHHFLEEVASETESQPTPDLWLVDAGERNTVAVQHSHENAHYEQYHYALTHADAAIDDLNALLFLYERLNAMAPYGAGFTYPDIAVSARLDECHISTMGKQKQHVKIVMPSGFTLLWWNSADEVETLRQSESITAHVELGENTFRGTTTPQGVVNKMHIYPKPQQAELQ